jgi:hypothetical protein
VQWREGGGRRSSQAREGAAHVLEASAQGHPLGLEGRDGVERGIVVCGDVAQEGVHLGYVVASVPAREAAPPDLVRRKHHGRILAQVCQVLGDLSGIERHELRRSARGAAEIPSRRRLSVGAEGRGGAATLGVVPRAAWASPIDVDVRARRADVQNAA